MVVISFAFIFVGALFDYLPFIPKDTSILLMAFGSLTILFLWIKYGRNEKV